jgi:cytoskeletal protein RodZ
MVQKKKLVSTSRQKQRFIVTIVIITLIIITGLVLATRYKPTTKTNNTSKTYNSKTANADPNVPGETSKTPSSGITSTKSPNDTSNGATPLSSVQPSQPIGNFVSNHSPSLRNSSSEASVCSTTPDVQCKITFTQGSVVKQLATQTTDGNGNTNWYWQLSDVGLGAGSWHVTAIATNGIMNATNNDPTVITVQP